MWGDLGGFRGQGHEVLTADRGDLEVSAAGHELLQADLQLVGQGVEGEGAQNLRSRLNMLP